MPRGEAHAGGICGAGTGGGFRVSIDQVFGTILALLISRDDRETDRGLESFIPVS